MSEETTSRAYQDGTSIIHPDQQNQPPDQPVQLSPPAQPLSKPDHSGKPDKPGQSEKTGQQGLPDKPSQPDKPLKPGQACQPGQTDKPDEPDQLDTVIMSDQLVSAAESTIPQDDKDNSSSSQPVTSKKSTGQKPMSIIV